MHCDVWSPRLWAYLDISGNGMKFRERKNSCETLYIFVCILLGIVKGLQNTIIRELFRLQAAPYSPPVCRPIAALLPPYCHSSGSPRLPLFLLNPQIPTVASNTSPYNTVNKYTAVKCITPIQSCHQIGCQAGWQQANWMERKKWKKCLLSVMKVENVYWLITACMFTWFITELFFVNKPRKTNLEFNLK